METYHGHVKTPNDAIILFEACRIGLLPRVQRRLSEKERQQIKSGSVFVWDEREAGMRRWTDGKSWSASRVSGSFLTYREMEGKRGGTSMNSPAPPPKAPTPKPASNGGDSDDEPGPDGYRYKADGLMKQSFSITTASGQHLHLISYYARHCSSASVLNQPSTDPNLRHIRPPKNMYPESTVNEATSTPVLTRSPMANPSPYLASPHPAPMPPGAAYAPYPPQYHSAHSYPSPSHTPPQYAIINLYPHHPGQPMHGQPIHYAPGHPYMYAHPPPPALQHPQHLGNPNIPPPPGRAPSYPSYTGLQHLPGNTPSRGPPPLHMHSPAIPHHYAPAAPEPGPQLPPVGAHVTNGRTSPPRAAPDPATESSTLAAPATSEAGVSPGRQIAPSLGNILNNPGSSENTTSRTGSNSPPATGAQSASAALNGTANNLPKLAEVGRPAMQAGIQALKALDRRALST